MTATRQQMQQLFKQFGNQITNGMNQMKAEIKTEMNQIKTEMNQIKTEMNQMKAEIGKIKVSIADMDKNISAQSKKDKQEIKQIKVKMDNKIKEQENSKIAKTLVRVLTIILGALLIGVYVQGYQDISQAKSIKLQIVNRVYQVCESDVSQNCNHVETIQNRDRPWVQTASLVVGTIQVGILLIDLIAYRCYGRTLI